MLDLAETLNPLLDKRNDRLEKGEEEDEDVAEVTLQLVFFDGEEAFKMWTADDSIYGAKCFGAFLEIYSTEAPLGISLKSGRRRIPGLCKSVVSWTCDRANSIPLSILSSLICLVQRLLQYARSTLTRHGFLTRL